MPGADAPDVAFSRSHRRAAGALPDAWSISALGNHTTHLCSRGAAGLTAALALVLHNAPHPSHQLACPRSRSLVRGVCCVHASRSLLHIAAQHPSTPSFSLSLSIDAPSLPFHSVSLPLPLACSSMQGTQDLAPESVSAGHSGHKCDMAGAFGNLKWPRRSGSCSNAVSQINLTLEAPAQT